jgi:uncharacterized protein YceK
MLLWKALNLKGIEKMRNKIVVLLVVLVIFLTGCSSSFDKVISVDGMNNQNRFVFTGDVYYISGAYPLIVIKDTETKNLYLLDNNSHMGGLSPWLDAEGKPMKGK